VIISGDETSILTNMPRTRTVAIALLLTLMSGVVPLAAGQATPDEPAIEPAVAPVVVDGVTLFRVRGMSAYPAERRAAEIARRIERLAATNVLSRESLRLDEVPGATEILADKQRVMAVVDLDARLERLDRSLLAQAYLSRIADAAEAYRHDRRPDVLTRRALYALGTAMVLALGLWAGSRVVRRLRAVLERRYKARVRDVHIQSFQIVRAEQLWRFLAGALRLFWLVVVLAAAYVYLQYALRLFPWTRALGHQLSAILIDPLRTMANGAISQIPNLVFLVMLALVTRYVLKLVRLFFENVAAGSVTLSSFDADWAWPTYRLVRILVIAFAVVIGYPYIPGANSDAFKGVSLFIGVVFSLGSSSVIANMLAGYSMTYRRTFRLGDRVRIGEHVGDVDRMRLMVTHLRTPKNEEIVVPNSVILGAEVINYSTLAKERGLILHTTVGIGYETPWRQVEAMLLEAAARTPGLLRSPEPFVLQLKLGDFCVTYELNAYCDDPQAMWRLYTALHQNILDVFNEHGVQIMTPAYEGDPERPKVVPRSEWYAAPARRGDTAT
jgi:small-conductance mechanosensitive channel